MIEADFNRYLSEGNRCDEEVFDRYDGKKTNTRTYSGGFCEEDGNGCGEHITLRTGKI